jgi:hypothetical protein
MIRYRKVLVAVTDPGNQTCRRRVTFLTVIVSWFSLELGAGQWRKDDEHVDSNRPDFGSRHYCRDL